MRHSSSYPLSLGLPVYNGQRYIEAAIRSILAQSFVDFELVISDNGSTDNTESISRSFAQSDSRVRYIRRPDNRGAAWNFNEVFRQARGEFFKLACYDDLHDPDYLRTCMQVYREAPSSVVLVHTNTQLIDENGRVLGYDSDRFNLTHQRASNRLHDYLERLHRHNALFGVIRSRAYARTRGLLPFVSSDTILLAELLLQGEFWQLDQPLFFRRDHPERSHVRFKGDHEGYASWYDPSRRSVAMGRRSRLMVEMARSVARSPLSHSEQLRCCRAVAKVWGPRYGRTAAIELRNQAVSFARPRMGKNTR